MRGDCPLYLHLLDRELGRSVGFSATERLVESTIKCLLLGTTSHLYTGISLAWENSAMTGLFPDLLSLLVQTGTLDLVSSHTTLDEFLATRLSLYHHDAQRYQMYFNDKERKAREAFIPTEFKPTSATAELARELVIWASEREGRAQSAIDGNLEGRVRQKVLETLSIREEQAITFALFARDLAAIGTNARTEGILRRRISSGYTKHYMDSAGSDIPTGVRRLGYFDAVARNFPLFDVHLLAVLLEGLGLSACLERPWKENDMFWARTGEWRGSGIHAALREEIVAVLCSLCKTVSEVAHSGASSLERYAIRRAMSSRLQAAIAKAARNSLPSNTKIDQAADLIVGIKTVLQRDSSFARNMEEVLAARNDNVGSVLIVVATEVERSAVLQSAKELVGTAHKLIFGKRRTYFDLGYLGSSHLLLVQTEMGSIAPGASLSTVGDAIDELNPVHVILVGIAFGVDPDKQKIGQILVSQQLQAYEIQRMGTDSEGNAELLPRGDKVTASTRILGRLRAATEGWTGSSVNFGLIISGEKLVDNLYFRNKLTKFFPEALGGEMEGAGLYSASVERKVDWILVKAICDWADGKKRDNKAERQGIAANQAANFVLHAIASGGFGPIPVDGKRLFY